MNIEPTPKSYQTNTMRYWAFISYSSKDKKWGQWLHKRLESYPIPKEFQGTELFDGAVLGKNLRPIFRDRDELAGSAELGPAILKALEHSRYLIVLCSKNSAKSEWVNKEIEDFRELGGENHILALILDGDPNATSIPGVPDSDECFPPALRYPLEPLAGDLRKDGDGKERGFLKVLAGISQIGFDTLYRRHERAARKRRTLLGATAIALISTFASLAWIAVHQKNINKRQKEEAYIREASVAWLPAAARAIEAREFPDALIHAARAVGFHDFGYDQIDQDVRSDFDSQYPKLFDRKNHALLSETLDRIFMGPQKAMLPIGSTKVVKHHQRPITYLLLSEDRKTLLSADKTELKSWNVESGELLATLPLELHGIFPSGDPTEVFAITDGEILRVDIKSLEIVRRITFSSTGGNHFSLFLKKNLLVDAGGPNILLHDLTSGALKQKIDVSPFTIKAEISPDGKYLAALTGGYGSSVNRLRVWTLSDLKVVNEDLVGDHFMLPLKWRPNSRELLVGLRSGLMQRVAIPSFERVAFEDGHDEQILSMTNIGDNLLATGSSDNTICLWDANTGQLLHRTIAQPFDIKALVYDEQSSLFYGALGNNNVFNPSDEQVLGVSQGLIQVYRRDEEGLEADNIPFYDNAVALPDGTMISISPGGLLRKWTNGFSSVSEPMESAHEALKAMDVHPLGREFCLSGTSDQIEFRDTSTLKLLRQFATGQGKIKSLAYSADGKQIFAGGEDNTLVIFDSTTGKRIQNLNLGDIKQNWADILAANPNGNKLAVAGVENKVVEFSASTREIVSQIPCKGQPVAIGYDSSGRYLTIATSWTLTVWDTKNNRPEFTKKDFDDPLTNLQWSRAGNTLVFSSGRYIYVSEPLHGEILGKILAHEARVRSLSLFPCGRLLASTGENGEIRLWDISLGDEVGMLAKGRSHLSSLHLSPDHKHLYAVEDFSSLFKVDCESMHVTKLRSLDEGKIYDLDLIPGGKNIVAPIFVRKKEGGKSLYWGGLEFIKPDGVEHQRRTHPIWSVSYSPSGKELLYGSYFGRVAELNLQSGQEKAFKEFGANIYSVAYSKNGKIVAAGDITGRLSVYSVDTNEELFSVKAHIDYIRDIQFIPGSGLIASCADDGNVIIRQAKDGSKARTILHSDKQVFSIRLSNDGKHLYAGGEEGVLYKFSTTDWSLVNSFRVPRNKSIDSIEERKKSPELIIASGRNLYFMPKERSTHVDLASYLSNAWYTYDDSGKLNASSSISKSLLPSANSGIHLLNEERSLLMSILQNKSHTDHNITKLYDYYLLNRSFNGCAALMNADQSSVLDGRRLLTLAYFECAPNDRETVFPSLLKLVKQTPWGKRNISSASSIRTLELDNELQELLIEYLVKQ